MHFVVGCKGFPWRCGVQPRLTDRAEGSVAPLDSSKIVWTHSPGEATGLRARQGNGEGQGASSSKLSTDGRRQDGVRSFFLRLAT